jgi:hypothetical protein
MYKNDFPVVGDLATYAVFIISDMLGMVFIAVNEGRSASERKRVVFIGGLILILIPLSITLLSFIIGIALHNIFI